MAVSHGHRGRAIIGALVIERASDWARAVARLHARADEWHVHLLADDRTARAAVLADLQAMPDLAIVA